MGLFSKLLGESEEDKAVKAVVNKMRLFLDNEKIQLEYMNPELRRMLLECPAYDRDPNGSGPFGFTESNPIPVNGSLGELTYLSRLETAQGERILYHRVGSIGKIDAFECVTFSGSEWFILFLDMYHPRRSRTTPGSFRFSKSITQFAGFHHFCEKFPYDFVEMKEKERESGLIEFYIPVSWITPQIQNGAYQRSIAHKTKLDIVKKRLTSHKTF
jgi:hypothetical protein